MKIAIDGPAGAGKSTVAKAIADRLKYIYIDTGAMYRAVTLVMLDNDILADDYEGIKKILNNIKIELLIDENNQKKIFCNGADITEKIREERVSSKVSEVSAIGIVREKLVELQREISRNKNVVMDGRDIGTVVLPDAEYKFFLDAKPEERAKRRYLELVEKNITYEEILNSVIVRDKKDSTRELSPLKQAEDALYIDTTLLNKEEVIEKILNYVKK